MMKFIKEKGGLFTTALFQVFFVAMQPLLIINHMIFPMLLCGFFISLIWTFNVKKVAFGNLADRLVYATGAMAGTGFGFWASSLIIKWL
jgi:hypothetical protein